jgi:non-homologous end joining protein Ku
MEPSDYPDTYTDRVTELIEAKNTRKSSSPRSRHRPPAT